MTDTSTPTSTTEPKTKKSSLGKWILRLVVAGVALVLLLVLGLYVFRNTLVRQGVIRGGKFATNLETGLDAADLQIGAGSLKLTSFDMNNLPDKDYKAPKILVMKSCSVAVQPKSLLTHTVQIDNITIDGLEVTLEQNGLKNNLNDLLASLKSNTPAAGDSSKSSPGKELKIGTLKITGTKVHVRGMMSLDLDLPDLTIQDPTNPDGRPMKIADLVGTVLVHLSKQIIENPAIPGGFKDGMKNATAIVDNLKGTLEKNLNQLKLPDNKALQDAGKNLQNLFGGNKKEGK